MRESRQVYLDNISNQLENQMIDLLLDDVEIVYICKNIINHCDIEED